MLKGEKGDPGIPGPKGDTGDVGPIGPMGDVTPAAIAARDAAQDAAASAHYDALAAATSAAFADEASQARVQALRDDLADPDKGASMVAFLPSGTGAVARTLQEKAREHVSLADFGPVGTEDDTATFQIAVNRAAERGAILYVPEGEYFVSASVNTMPFPYFGGIRLPSNSHIRMAPGAVIRVIPNALSKYMVFSCYDAENVTIEGGQIIGDRTAHTYPNLFTTLAALTANNYSTKDNYDPDPAVWPDGSVAYVWQGGANNGTYTRASGEWSRTSTTFPNYITHEFGTAIDIVNSRNITVRNVKVSDMTGDAMHVGVTNQGPASNKKTSGVHISGCTFEACRRQGISVVDGDNVTVIGNFFRDIGIRKNMQDGAAPRSGIDIESGGLNKTSGVTVSGNVFKNCLGGSVIQYDGNNVSITGNVADTAMSYGFGVNTSIVGNTVTKGGITGNSSRVPISFTYTQSGGVITVTTVSPHGLYTGATEYFTFYDANGLVAHSGEFVVTAINPTTLTFSTPGFVSPSGSGAQKYLNNNVVISGNNMIDGGVSLVGKAINVSDNNIVNGSIAAFGGAEGCLISGNMIRASAEYGIRLFAGTSRMHVSGNSISGARAAAIHTASTGVVVSANSINGCYSGVDVVGGDAHVSGNTIDLGDWVGVNTSTYIGVSGSASHSVIDGNILLNGRGVGVGCSRPATVIHNKIMRHAGSHAISVTTANSAGSRVVGNLLESNRDATGTAVAIVVSGNTDARVMGNTIYSINAPWFRAIDTASSTTSRITNNVHAGPINSHASDTLAGNVGY